MRKALFLHSTISNGLIWCLFLSWLSPGVCSKSNPTLLGFYPCAEADWESGFFRIPFNKVCRFTLFGTNFTHNTYVYVTNNPDNCTSEAYPRYSFKLTLPKWINDSTQSQESYLDLVLPNDPDELGNSDPLYFCFDYDNTANAGTHQGSMPWLRFLLYNDSRILPIPVEIIFVLCLIVLSACFSGLNLGLMSLNLTELKIVISCGSKWEKRFARVIYPIRKHGNYLLCTLLLGNVLVNSAFTILLDSLTSGAIAVAASTIIIVIFGEIIPQAICNRYGLFVGVVTLPLTITFLVLTFPLSFPISKLLDCILGEELGTNYKREELLELVKQDKQNLEQDEKNIIAGALEFKHKTAADVMTPINKVFMLEIKNILDFKTMMRIAQSGHSRIPVYENDPTNIIGLLFVKDLIFHDADDKIPLSTIVKFYNHQVKSVYYDTTLDKILNEFKTGQTHLAIVIKVNDEGEGDPFHENLGVISLEDIIEEIIQCEIVDESDRYFDNRTYAPVERSSLPDFHVFLDADSTTAISAQQSLAVYLYLSTSVEPFKTPSLTKRILQRLVEQDIYWSISKEQVELNDYYLYEKGKQANHFTLILEGKLQVTVGNDNLQYEAGPFTTFGTNILTRYMKHSDQKSHAAQIKIGPYIPDFSVKPLTDVTILYIPFRHYIVAVKASCAEKDAEFIFEEEWQKTKEQDPIRPADAYILVHHGTAINHKSSSEEEPPHSERHPPARHRYKRRVSTRSINSLELGYLDLEAYPHKNNNGNEMLIKRMNSCVNSSDSDNDDNIIASDKSRLIK